MELAQGTDCKKQSIFLYVSIYICIYIQIDRYQSFIHPYSFLKFLPLLLVCTECMRDGNKSKTYCQILSGGSQYLCFFSFLFLSTPLNYVTGFHFVRFSSLILPTFPLLGLKCDH